MKNEKELIKTVPDIPAAYKPISAWGYFGYNILFSIPLVGFVLLLVFSFDNNQIVRRNYARSFFCSALVVVGLIVIALIFVIALGISLDNLSVLDKI